jgi:hypothetical protein
MLSTIMSASEKIKAQMKKTLAVAITEYQVSLVEGYDYPTLCVANMPNGNTEYYAIEDLEEDSVKEAIALAGGIGAVSLSLIGLGSVMEVGTGDESDGICLMIVANGKRYTMFQVLTQDEDFELVSGKILDLGEQKITATIDMKKHGFEP